MSRSMYDNQTPLDELPLFANRTTSGEPGGDEAAPPPTPVLTPRALDARDRAIESLRRNAGSEFIQAAAAYALELLRTRGPLTGEQITDGCKAAGIVPHDDKAFGPVIGQLVRRNQIERAGFAQREKGHGTSGGNVWSAKR